MIVRQARMEDAAEICAIVNPVIRDTLFTFTTKERRVREIAAEIAMGWRTFQVIETGGQVTGFACYGPFRAGPGYAHTKELTIHLAPRARGQGMGRALLQKLEQVAIAQDVHVLVAGISATNPDGIAFHAACGYAEVGRMPEVGQKAGQKLGLVLMQKILPEGDSAADSGGTAG